MKEAKTVKPLLKSARSKNERILLAYGLFVGVGLYAIFKHGQEWFGTPKEYEEVLELQKRVDAKRRKERQEQAEKNL